MSERCGTCKHFLRDNRPQFNERGNCLRYPPVIISAVATDPWGGLSSAVEQHWPYMTENEVCGEYDWNKRQ